MSYSLLAPLNAVLNSIAAAFLIAGFVFIRMRRVRAHRACMLTAFGFSIAFLISYLTDHYHFGDVRFLGVGVARTVYFSILIPHVILATIIVPLVLVTLWFAVRARFTTHRKIARFTLPIWLFVSLSGVVVYVMLYRLYPHSMPASAPRAATVMVAGRR